MSDVNIPQLVFLAVVGFLVIRWCFKPSAPSDGLDSSSSSSRSGATSPGTRGVVSPQFVARVDRVVQMFPQLERRDILWDLQRNGGNVQMTTERVLTTGRLATPPQSFQPTFPTPAGASPASPTPRPPTAGNPAYPDLITRYNLSSRVGGSADAAASATPPDDRPVPASAGSAAPAPKEGWSSNKAERARLLQKRREEMILMARRKMEAKEGA